MTDITTIVKIDWQDDGFDSAIDDVTDDIRSGPGISIQRGKDTARPRAQPMIDAADVTLGNQSNRYTSENAGSDIYPYAIPDRPIRVSISTGVDIEYNQAATTYDEPDTYYNGAGELPIFTGLTEEPQETRNITSERHVLFRALGRMSLLKDIIIDTDLYEGIRTDEAIGHVLDAAGWPADDRVLSIGDTTINWWWADQQDAWSALRTLLETEGAGASLYEDGMGRIHFENRLYRSINTRSTTSQATFDADPDSADPGFVSYAYNQNVRDIYNNITFRNDIRYPREDEVWEAGDTVSFGANESYTWHAHVQYPIDSMLTPTVTTDYVVTSGSVAAFTATKVYANLIDITITAGAGGLTIDGPGGSTRGPQVRAMQLVPGYIELLTTVASAPESPYANRNRSLDLVEAGAWPHVSAPTAQALCDAAANYYSEGRPFISLEIANRDQTRVDQFMQREISDRITIDGGANEFVGDAWIEQLNYSIQQSGRIGRLGITASRASVGSGYVENPALWDTGAWDEDVWGN